MEINRDKISRHITHVTVAQKFKLSCSWLQLPPSLSPLNFVQSHKTKCNIELSSREKGQNSRDKMASKCQSRMLLSQQLVSYFVKDQNVKERLSIFYG